MEIPVQKNKEYIVDIIDNGFEGEDAEKWKMVRGWSSVQYIKDFDTLEAIVNKHQKEGTSAIYLAASGFMGRGIVDVGNKVISSIGNQRS